MKRPLYYCSSNSLHKQPTHLFLSFYLPLPPPSSRLYSLSYRLYPTRPSPPSPPPRPTHSPFLSRYSMVSSPHPPFAPHAPPLYFTCIPSSPPPLHPRPPLPVHLHNPFLPCPPSPPSQVHPRHHASPFPLPLYTQ